MAQSYQLRTLYILLIFCFSTGFAFSQTRHFISVWGGGGYSLLYHGIEDTRSPGGAGFNVGLGYELQLNERFIFTTGAEFHHFGSRTRLSDYSINYIFEYSHTVGNNTVTSDMDFQFNFLEYSNRFRAGFVNFPIMVGLRSERYYALIGSKIGINLTGNYRLNALVHPLPTDEFATGPFDIFPPMSSTRNGNLNLGLNATASAEFGVILDEWLPRGMMNLNDTRRTPLSYRAGFFVDYGLLNLNRARTNNALLTPQDIHDPLVFGMNDLSSSDLANGHRFGNLYAGVKLTVLFQANRDRQRRPPPEPIMFFAQVVDAETRNPLDAEVTVRTANRQAFRGRTDADGFVSHELRAGRYIVNAQADGYAAFRQNITHNRLDTLVIPLQVIPIFYVHVVDAETGENLRAEVAVNATTANNPLVFRQTTDAESGMLRYELRPGRYRLQVTAEGYIYHQREFEFTRTETIRVALQEIKQDVRFVLDENQLFFAVNRAVFLPGSEPALDQMYQFLVQNPTVEVYIIGHTDSTGSLAFNMTLSKDRARALYNELVARGIDPSRLTYEGRGPNEPIDTNETEAGRARNRRVEVIIR